MPTKNVLNTHGNNRQNNEKDGANIVGAEIYANLKNHLKSYLIKICEVRSLA
jgi:hypothetical protein